VRNLVVLLLLFPSITFSQSGIIFRDQCESEPTYNWRNPFPNYAWNWKSGDNLTSSLAVSDSFSRLGTSSYRIVLNRTSQSHLQYSYRENNLTWNYIPAGSKATEAAKVGQPEATTKSILGLRWMSVSTYLPVGFQFDNTRESIGFLVKNFPDETQFPQNLEINNGRYILHTALWNGGSSRDTVVDLGTIKTGVWEDWILERNFTNETNGFVRFYRNGQLVFSATGGNWPPLALGFAYEPYVQHGISKNSWVEPLANAQPNAPTIKAIYYDEFRFGNESAPLSDFIIGSNNNPPPGNNGNLPKTSAMIFYDNCEIPGMPYSGMSSTLEYPSFWDRFQGDPSVSSLVQTSAVKRAGNSSYRFELINGIGNNYNFLKGELVWNFLPAGSPLGTIGDTKAFYKTPVGLRWIASSIMVPSANLDYNTPTSIGFNVKSVEDDWGTPFSLQMYQNRYEIFYTKVKKTGSVYTYQSVGPIDMGPVVKDKWEDWVLNRNWTSADSGYIRFYKNGQLVHEYLGGNWADDGKHSKEPYVQVGLYKWAYRDDWQPAQPAPNANNVIIYVDEMKFGNATGTLSDFLVNTSNNQAPIVNAGADQLLRTPSTRTYLSGTAADNDGTIYAKYWRKIGGPAGGFISDSLQNNITITELQEGTYTYQLVATDNGNSTTTDNVVITVQSPVLSMVYFNVLGAGITQTGTYTYKGGSTSNAVALANSAIYGDFSLQMTIGPNTAGAYLAIDNDNYTDHIYTPGQIWVSAYSGKIYYGDYNNQYIFNLTGTVITTGDFVRIRRVGDTYLLEYSKDNGLSWTYVYTYLKRSPAPIWVKVTFDNIRSTVINAAIATGSQIVTNTAVQRSSGLDQPIETVKGKTKISPNPAKDFVTIRAGDDLGTGAVKLLVMDNNGRIIRQKQLPNFQKNSSLQVSTKELRNGLFMFILEDGNGNRSKHKIIVQH
jgi:hypothetical protein